ncbi:MAG: pseudouridine synthase [Desulfovibrio sp.]|nr:pseudouridine synthase [Desulfovibrio sp.]
MQACEMIVEEAWVGQRLDRALQLLCPANSLRARRRLIEAGQVLVNGKPAVCATKLSLHDVVSLCLCQSQALAPAARFLQRQGELLFFYKPRGLNSVHLAGSPNPSLEALLPALSPSGQTPRLVQRLDFGTSGLVAAVSSLAAQTQFRAAEDAGLVEKKYLALLQGLLPSVCQAKMALDTKKRRRTKLQSAEAPWSRCTTFIPLAHFASGSALPPWLTLSLDVSPCDLTLAGCVIHKGARHQIRAHAAGLGYPLFGDTLYGGKEYSCFFLHQAALFLPATECLCWPDWLKPESLPRAFSHWLCEKPVAPRTF